MSTISVHMESARVSKDWTQRINDWLQKVVESEGLQCGEIALILVNDEELLEVNQKYLHHDYYTDVITFDYTEGRVVSGDVFISVERILDNAKQLNIKDKDEFHRVLVHGILHLCGYEDKAPEAKLVMTQKEDYYLSLRAF